MAALRSIVKRIGLDALNMSGAHHLLRPFVGGVGVILMLHSVRPPRSGAFQPNAPLEISPDLLERVVIRLRESAVDIVSLDELHHRLTAGDFSRRFACLTFDDGYRDNRDFAYPVLKRHGAPFAIYVTTRFLDQRGVLWWIALERIVGGNDRVEVALAGERVHFSCPTLAEKRATFDAVGAAMRRIGDPEELKRTSVDMAARYGVDLDALCRELCLDWEEVRALQADPLVTIGGHTTDHVNLKAATQTQARTQMQENADAIEARLGRRPAHFAFPYGGTGEAGPREFRIAAERGFRTAVTTRAGVLFPEHGAHLTALPRMALTGEWQRNLDVFLSGSATALASGFRRLDVA
jgi:peptidoglycan/xylan/chitin deacetylase (PgdA/CDA1 family)